MGSILSTEVATHVTNVTVKSLTPHCSSAKNVDGVFTQVYVAVMMTCPLMEGFAVIVVAAVRTVTLQGSLPSVGHVRTRTGIWRIWIGAY